MTNVQIGGIIRDSDHLTRGCRNIKAVVTGYCDDVISSDRELREVVINCDKAMMDSYMRPANARYSYIGRDTPVVLLILHQREKVRYEYLPPPLQFPLPDSIESSEKQNNLLLLL